MTGFLAHLMVPFSSQAQKTAFTRWLDHNVVESGNENELKLRNTIRELTEQTGDFWVLLQEASELVANHRDHFKILVASGDKNNTQEGTSWLIDQWNIFQHQNSGFNSVLVESIKILSNWIPQNLDFAIGHIHSHRNQLRVQTGNSYHITTFLSETISPLISGISINAP